MSRSSPSIWAPASIAGRTVRPGRTDCHHLGPSNAGSPRRCSSRKQSKSKGRGPGWRRQFSRCSASLPPIHNHPARAWDGAVRGVRLMTIYLWRDGWRTDPRGVHEPLSRTGTGERLRGWSAEVGFARSRLESTIAGDDTSSAGFAVRPMQRQEIIRRRQQNQPKIDNLHSDGETGRDVSSPGNPTSQAV
jgi:hypothetical protein